MAAQQTKADLFDLHKKAAAVKQIQLASSAKDRNRLSEETLETSEGKFPVRKGLIARTNYFSNITELSFGVHMQPRLS